MANGRHRFSRQVTDAFPWDTAPRYLLRDRDASYGSYFCSRVEAMGITQVVALCAGAHDESEAPGRVHLVFGAFAGYGQSWARRTQVSPVRCRTVCRPQAVEASRSEISLSTYAKLDKAQNVTSATPASTASCGRKSRWLKTRAARTNPFLTHCHGRANTISARHVPRFAAYPSAAGSQTEELTRVTVAGNCAAISPYPPLRGDRLCLTDGRWGPRNVYAIVPTQPAQR
jgi:hypothetical protein